MPRLHAPYILSLTGTSTPLPYSVFLVSPALFGMPLCQSAQNGKTLLTVDGILHIVRKERVRDALAEGAASMIFEKLKALIAEQFNVCLLYTSRCV